MPTMEVKSNFKFRVNVSNDYYVKKTDASACLSLAGAKAIKKVKMAFREQDVTVDEFLTYALNGYAFCNLFDFDPDQSYWFETGDGHRYQTTPLYKDGTNKGCMRLVFKSDRFFSGAQTVFVDIDLTRFDSIPEYIDCLTIKPTCVYMSYSDKLEKDRVTSRRFRMVYVFDRIMGKEDLNVISRTITDSIIRDTGEPMKDDCGTRISQYFNGVYDNEESYAFYNIYSRLDFPESLPVIEDVMPDEQSTKKPEVEFDSHLLHDMGSMDYETFMHYNSLKYRYIYKTQKDEWIDGLYQLTDDNYIQLWWVRERIKDGHHRRRTLSKFACLRRLMKPDIDPDTLLFNMYVDLHRFIDNSDGIITIETMKRRVKSVVKMSQDELMKYCDYEIGYWKEHRPKFIYHPSVCYKTQWMTGKITTSIRYSEIDGKYDRTRSVRENAETLEIPVRSLYRYCQERGIDTNPGKGMTYKQQREANREARLDKKARFMMLYDPSLSLGQNREKMMKEGLKLSKNTIRKWSKGYVSYDQLLQPEPQATMDNAFSWESQNTYEPTFNTGQTGNTGFGVYDDQWKDWYSYNGMN